MYNMYMNGVDVLDQLVASYVRSRDTNHKKVNAMKSYLTQNGRPLLFASRSLTISIMSEGLLGLEKIKPYFIGTPITVLTDHGNLLTDHMQRCQMYLR